jgi:hypothetical protein
MLFFCKHDRSLNLIFAGVNRREKSNVLRPMFGYYTKRIVALIFICLHKLAFKKEVHENLLNFNNRSYQQLLISLLNYQKVT